MSTTAQLIAWNNLWCSCSWTIAFNHQQCTENFTRRVVGPVFLFLCFFLLGLCPSFSWTRFSVHIMIPYKWSVKAFASRNGSAGISTVVPEHVMRWLFMCCSWPRRGQTRLCVSGFLGQGFGLLPHESMPPQTVSASQIQITRGYMCYLYFEWRSKRPSQRENIIRHQGL